MCEKLFYLFFCLAQIFGAYGKFRYDYTYYAAAEGWMKVHHVPATFTDAFLRCDFEGAILASPSNKDLAKVLKHLHPKLNENCGMYTGIHSTISHGDYTTIDGIPLERLPVQWSIDEPDNFENREDCLIMLPNGTLADVKCNEAFPYVCYKQKTKNLVITECGTTDPEYKLDARTGSCYKFHRMAMSWRRAQMMCVAEGGHLAIINSPTEATVLKELFARNPANTISPQANFKDVAAVGFLDWGTERLWYTVHGQRLDQAGYSSWSNGQPDNATNKFKQGSSCGAIFRTALLDDFWCDDMYVPFICEKTPESLAADDDEQ